VVSRDRNVIPATRYCEDWTASKERHCVRGRVYDYAFEKDVTGHDRAALPPPHRPSPVSLARTIVGPCITNLACGWQSPMISQDVFLSSFMRRALLQTRTAFEHRRFCQGSLRLRRPLEAQLELTGLPRMETAVICVRGATSTPLLCFPRIASYTRGLWQIYCKIILYCPPCLPPRKCLSKLRPRPKPTSCSSRLSLSCART
jgi:hypothetical protein